VLAAFGTALPESVVTFVAVAFGDSAAQKDIGVGATRPRRRPSSSR
jgi:cation:H+ antiporter